MQREASIEDQLRNIQNYCTRNNLPMPIAYKDQAISGSRNDRPGYLEMLAAANAKSFDILLVDDLDRLSRDNIGNLTTIRQFKFLGIRIIGVSDGIDTARDNSKIETSLRGLMGELYLDDLAKKTHRGLEGQFLKGYSAGAKPYGYNLIPDGNGSKLAINNEQAQWIRYIFKRYSEGAAARQIATELNEKGVKGPAGGTWSPSSIHPSAKEVGMLCNSTYIGSPMFDKTKWVKDPTTGKRLRTMRPKEEWKTVNLPELRIIDDETWIKCDKRIRAKKAIADENRKNGKGSANGKGCSSSAPSKYLFSGLLKCGVCGANYTMVNKTKYGCAFHKDRGNSVCSNNLQIKRSTVEGELLTGIKRELLSEEAYLDFEKNVRASLKSGAPDASLIKKKIADTQKEIDNLIKAIMGGIDSPSVKAALRDSEQKLKDVQGELKEFERYQPTELIPRAREMYEDLVSSLGNTEHIEIAREALRQLVGEVVLRPTDGFLTAEVPSSGLHIALKINLVAGAGCAHYLQPQSLYIALK
jgi:DNA invertase Pin-like site-specific DNA recombinase